jgi:feruloyl-CoA synthase
VFPDVEACRRLGPHKAADAKASEIVERFEVRQHFAALLSQMARVSTGSSNRVARVILCTEPPSMDRGEMTDKGSINQRAVLNNRAALVEELYRDEESPRVIKSEG